MIHPVYFIEGKEKNFRINVEKPYKSLIFHTILVIHKQNEGGFMDNLILLKEAFKKSVVPTLIIDQSGTCVFANDEAEKLLDVEKEKKRSFFFYFTALFNVSLAQLLTLLKESIEKTIRVQHISTLEYDMTIKPIKTSKSTYQLIQFNEVSLSLEKQDAVLRELNQYKRFIEESQDAFLVVVDEKVRYVNPAAIRLLGGRSKYEYIGKELLTFIHEDDIRFVKERMDAIMQDKPFRPRVEVKILAKEGVKFIESSVTKMEFQGKPAIQYFMRDITNRKKYDEMARTSEKLTMVSKLAAGVAHEIRNPMTAVKGFIQLLKVSKEYNEEYSEIMIAEIERIEVIIEEFLTLAKSKKETAYKPKQLCRILQHVALLLNTHASYRDCQITTDLTEVDVWIYCEENALKQVFINVIQNAIESMTRGTVHISLKTEGSLAVVEITDEGCGMEESVLQKIGEPFFSTKETGTGLGLMISYKIIEQHKGKMTFTSKIGVGTKVKITLPIVLNCEKES